MKPTTTDVEPKGATSEACLTQQSPPAYISDVTGEWRATASAGCHAKSKGPIFMRINYAIVFVSDMKRAVSFYRDVVGLPLKFESPGWTEFATDGATLALHASDGPKTGDGDLAHSPPGRCRPGLSVPNIDEFHKRMVEKNVPCVQEPKLTFGVRIAQYADPDGLVFSVAEHANRS